MPAFSSLSSLSNVFCPLVKVRGPGSRLTESIKAILQDAEGQEEAESFEVLDTRCCIEDDSVKHGFYTSDDWALYFKMTTNVILEGSFHKNTVLNPEVRTSLLILPNNLVR